MDSYKCASIQIDMCSGTWQKFVTLNAVRFKLLDHLTGLIGNGRII